MEQPAACRLCARGARAIVREHRARPLPRQKWGQKAPAGCQASAPRTRQQQSVPEERVKVRACGCDDNDPTKQHQAQASAAAAVTQARFLGPGGRGWQIQAPSCRSGTVTTPWNWCRACMRIVQLQRGPNKMRR